MKNECLEIFNKVGQPHGPLKPVAQGEDLLLEYYDASYNKYPENCLYATDFQEIIEEKISSQKHDYSNIHERKMYLWVMKENQIRIILESTPVECNRTHASHPNLTGGEDAIIGGELWFFKNPSGEIEVHINLDSGRYTARDVPSQLPAVMKLFECVGYIPKKLIV